MSDEKRQVLEMLEAGKITQEDAVRLLEALGEEQEEGTSQTEPQESPKETGKETSNQEVDWAAALEDLGATVDAAVNEASQAAGAALREAKDVMTTAAKEAKAAWKDGSFFGVVWPKEGGREAPPPVEENYANEAPVGGPIHSIYVQWVNGPVEVRSWEGNTIRVAEYASRPLDENTCMHLKELNGNLTIRWSRKNVVFGRPRQPKHLVIELPRDVRLEKLKVDTVSGPVNLQEFSTATLKVETMSGPVDLRQFQAGILKVDTVSGAVQVWGCAEEVSLETVSGDLWFAGEAMPNKVNLDSVSGKLHVALPQGIPGFSLEYSSVSGKFHSQFPLTGELSGRSGKAVYGDGGAQLRMETVSGGMWLMNGQQ